MKQNLTVKTKLRYQITIIKCQSEMQNAAEKWKSLPPLSSFSWDYWMIKFQQVTKIQPKYNI